MSRTPIEYFYYKGQHYGSGTDVVLKDEYINNHTENGKKIWKTARFTNKFMDGNVVKYVFNIRRPDWYDMKQMGISQDEMNTYAVWFKIDALMLENAIEEITKPILPPENVTFRVPGFHEDMTPVKDTEVPELMVAWVVFIAFLVFSLVFKQWYILWPIAGFVFDKIRNEMLDR